MMHRPVQYTLDVIINHEYGSDKEYDHPKMQYTDLRDILDDYLDQADPDVTSFVFTVSRIKPKDWIVVVFSGEDMETFGPFNEKGDAIRWAESEIGSTDWRALAIDRPTTEKPAHNVEGTIEHFNRFVAGDR